MAILSKACKPGNFESHKSLKLSFTNIRGLRSNFVDCESFLESNSPDILALCETNLADSIDSGDFSVTGYLPLIRKDSSTHMHGLAVYVKEGLPFARDLSLKNSADSYLCFRLALLHSVSYLFFLYRSPSTSLCTVFDSISSNIDEVLSIKPSANVFVFGDLNVHHKDWLTYSGGTDRPGELCYNFSISSDLTQIFNFPTRIPDCDSHSPALLDLFISSDTSICPTMAFPPLGNSDHVVVSVSIDFPINTKQDTPFYRMAYEYSRADWDGLRDHLRDVPWEDIFKLSASAASEFCEWAQVGIDVYISHRKYQVKPHSSPWFSAACAAAIVYRNHFFRLYRQDKSSESKIKFRQTSNRCKRVLEAAKLVYATKTKESIISQKPDSRNFWRIANSVLNKGKSAIPPLFNGPEVLSSASDKAKSFAKNFSKNSNLDDSGICLPVFPSRTNLKLHNISITSKMVKKVITNLDSSKASGPDCIPVVVLKNCEPELSYVLAKLFNKCLKESCFPDCWKVSSVVPVFKNVGERSTAKNYRPVSLLSVVSKVFEKLVNSRIVDHLEKCGLFSDFQYGFRSSRSTADLLTVVSDRIARAFNRSGATQAVALDISKAFDRVWHACPLHKFKSYGISGQIFGLISSFLSNRQLCVVLDGKSSQVYPVNAGVPQGSILGPTLFLLYINDLSDDVICNIAIYADDTTLYPKYDQASDLWQRLELASELESDLRDTVDWGRKWLVDFNAGKTQLVSFARSKNTGAIDVKMDGSVLEEKLCFKMLGLTFSSKLDWGSYLVSIAKTASKKIGALIHSMKFLSPEVALYLYKSTIRPCMEYCCHVWAGGPSCYLELLDKLQKRICRTVGPAVAASLERLAHRRNVASLSLFYRYYRGRCSSELAQLVPLPYSRGRSTRYSDRLHDFSVTIPRCYKDVYVNSFFPRTARLWNSLPIECFPLTYDLSGFNSRINRYLLTVGSY